MWMWILIGLDIITKVHGFANGNFPQSCDSLSPQHASGGTNFPAQTSAAPFRVDFESSNPADPITVVLRSTGSTKFKGFMMEAREAALAGRLIGSFIPLDGSTTRLLMCNGSAGSAVSQSNNQRKSLLKFNWTAPEINQDIIFRATFVQDFATFWENVTATFRLPTTTPAPSTTTTTPAPSTTTTTPAPRTTTTTPASRTTTTTPASSKTTINPTHTPNISGFVTKLGTALMCGDLSLELVKTDMPKIFVMAKGTHYRRFSEVSKTVVSILCLGVEIASLILFAVEFSSNGKKRYPRWESVFCCPPELHTCHPLRQC
ncbi:putative ferric-chelate reductase 1 isoform X2 [Acanthochromis polyacanthus]|uniref:putative ferric-chelate reductase 1 isoform X2 n=1 Tax=Acanthochromis polyacanthus TaxID=80966 RepID=UPI002234C9CD|nr:putative ferric-chelate reductase 1 isoform X2 [Acanthochromis polyacanthus]